MEQLQEARPPARLGPFPQILRLRGPAIGLGLLLAVALALRLYGINWDQGHLFHPDERAILWCVADLGNPPEYYQEPRFCGQAQAPWNPHWFPYGSFPLYLLKGVQTLLSPIERLSLADLRFPGRAVSALADVLVVLVVYLLGRRLYGRRVGFVAAALTTFAVLHIQLSHFYAVDTLLTLLVALTMLALVGVIQDRGLGASALAGVFLGLALATKVSSAPLLLPVVLAHGLLAFSAPGETLCWQWPSRSRFRQATTGLVAAGLASGSILFIAQPYAFLDWSRFLSDVLEQSEMVRLIRDYPYTRQYIGTTPYLYHLRQLTLFGLGPPLGALAWLGLLFSVLMALLRRNKGDILLLSWVIPLLAITGAFEVKLLRYLLPATPFLILFGSRAALFGLEWAREHRKALVPWAQGGLALVIAATAFYAVAYLRIYREPHPAVRASRWINANVPPGSLLLQEHWEEGIPGLGRYRAQELPMYDPDSQGKLSLLAEGLSHADYLLLYSQRLYGTIPRLPERYPASSRYYQLLFSGQLGYELAHFETAVPSLLGIAFDTDPFRRPMLPAPEPLASFRPAPVTFNLGFADESFDVYDHPKVLIFKRTLPLEPEQVLALFKEEPATPLPTAGATLTPSERAAQRAGGTWREIIKPEAFWGRFPVAGWLPLVYAFSFATLPLALLLFRRLPDRGYLLAKPLGLLLFAYFPWLLASLKWMPFGRASLLLSLGLLLATCLLLGIRNRQELGGFLRSRWRLLGFEEGVFLLAFFSFLALRLANPDLWHPWRGGEKPMDLAYLNAILRSSFMPPYDPWFAGGAINYYYFGQFLVAAMIKATGILPEVAYNLAVALFFALTVGAAFSVVYNLAEGTRRARGITGWGWPPLAAGLAGGLFVAVLGNMDGAVQLLQGAWNTLVQHGAFPDFDFWRSTRMMPPDPPGFEITEFPFFTFLYADLHAHLLALPLTLLALGLGLSIMLEATEKGSMGATAATVVVLGLVIGSLPATNIWDLPMSLALALGAVALGQHLRHHRWRAHTLRDALLLGGLLTTSVLLLFLPYHLRYQSVFQGVVLSRFQTPFYQYLGIYGLFFFLAVSLLLREALPLARRSFFRPAFETLSPPTAQALAPDTVRKARGKGRWALLGASSLALGAFTLLIATTLAGYTTVAVLVLLAGCALFVARHHLLAPQADSPFLLFGLLLLLGGLAIGIGADLLTVRGDIDRMNTVFKLYIGSWVLLALVAAYGLWRVGFMGSLLRRPLAPGKVLWALALALLLFSSSIYPLLGTRGRLKDRFAVLPLTLNGMAYMEQATYTDDRGTTRLGGDLEAIRWMRENVSGSPVVLEGLTPLYRWGGRVSIYTGLPSVVGWDWHQTQQRCGASSCPAVNQRKEDVNTIYTTRDGSEALRLLRKYRVEYVYVGETERLYYPEAGIAKFEDMALAGQLQDVYSRRGVHIYLVAGAGGQSGR